MSFRVTYKTPHNMFYRKFWFVESAEVQGNFWCFRLKWNRIAYLPMEGTIVKFGRGYSMVPTSK